MTKSRRTEVTKVLSVRFPESLIRRLDRFVRKFQHEFPGISFQRTDAIRLFVERGLKAPSGETPKTGRKAETQARVPQFQIIFSEKAQKKTILALINSVKDKRFQTFRKKLLGNLVKTAFRAVFLDTYVQLGCWANSAASFSLIAEAMQKLAKEMFGYKIPAEISGVLLKKYKNSPMEVLAEISPPLIDYHKSHLT